VASTRITWTPIDHGTGTRTLDLGPILAGTRAPLLKFEGFVRGAVSHSISIGGVSVSRTHDTWHQFLVEIESLGPKADPEQFALLTAWWSHALRRGEFAFALDSDKASSTILNGARVATNTVLTLDASTGMTAGDWLFLEALDNAAVFERRKILTVDSGTQVTLTAGLTYDYPDNSVVRHAEFLPACVVLETENVPFFERPGGEGDELWDLRFPLRTVR